MNESDYCTKKDLEDLYKKIEDLFPKVELLEPAKFVSIPRKKRNYIYLAGTINDNSATYEWRKKFTKLMEDEPNVIIVNPCANAFNQGMKKIGNDGLEFTKEAKKRSQKILRAKDYQLIKMSNIVVVNLGFNKPEKPMVGTIQELAWASEIFYVPVIAITNGEDNIYTNHPWLDECYSAKVETVEEAAEMIKTFFLEY